MRPLERQRSIVGAGTGAAVNCVQCGMQLPEGRKKYCSTACLARFKRERARLNYGHRHKFVCVDCGHHARLGRHRK